MRTALTTAAVIGSLVGMSSAQETPTTTLESPGATLDAYDVPPPFLLYFLDPSVENGNLWSVYIPAPCVSFTAEIVRDDTYPTFTFGRAELWATDGSSFEYVAANDIEYNSTRIYCSHVASMDYDVDAFNFYGFIDEVELGGEAGSIAHVTVEYLNATTSTFTFDQHYQIPTAIVSSATIPSTSRPVATGTDAAGFTVPQITQYFNPDTFETYWSLECFGVYGSVSATFSKTEVDNDYTFSSVAMYESGQYVQSVFYELTDDSVSVSWPYTANETQTLTTVVTLGGLYYYGWTAEIIVTLTSLDGATSETFNLTDHIVNTNHWKVKVAESDSSSSTTQASTQTSTTKLSSTIITQHSSTTATGASTTSIVSSSSHVDSTSSTSSSATESSSPAAAVPGFADSIFFNSDGSMSLNRTLTIPGSLGPWTQLDVLAKTESVSQFTFLGVLALVAGEDVTSDCSVSVSSTSASIDADFAINVDADLTVVFLCDAYGWMLDMEGQISLTPGMTKKRDSTTIIFNFGEGENGTYVVPTTDADSWDESSASSYGTDFPGFISLFGTGSVAFPLASTASAFDSSSISSSSDLASTSASESVIGSVSSVSSSSATSASSYASESVSASSSASISGSSSAYTSTSDAAAYGFSLSSSSSDGISSFEVTSSTGAPYSNISSTSTEIINDATGTTVITITSCSNNACSEVAVTTGLTAVTTTESGVVTEYTTYCPLTAEDTTSALPTAADVTTVSTTAAAVVSTTTVSEKTSSSEDSTSTETMFQTQTVSIESSSVSVETFEGAAASMKATGTIMALISLFFL